MIYAKLKTASEKREEAGGSSFTFRKWIAFRHIGTDEWNGRMAQLVEPTGQVIKLPVHEYLKWPAHW